MAQLTESPAAVRIFVLHDDAVHDLSELLEVSLQTLVGGRVIETSDEDLSQDFTLRAVRPLLVFGGCSLDLDLGVVDGVGGGLETGLGLVHARVSDEPEPAEKLS